MREKVGFIIVGIFIVSGLSFSYFANTNDLFSSLADPQFGQGLGALCSSEKDCLEFCNNSMGRCIDYCNLNSSNSLCTKLNISKTKTFK